MGKVNLEEIQTTTLKRVKVSGGDVLHGLKMSDPSFVGFGEAYFSIVNPGAVKAWKRHRQMTLNLMVPLGKVKFVFHDCHSGNFREEVIGQSNYCRLTVPPLIWFGFQGIDSVPSLLLNISDIAHNPDEVETRKLTTFTYNWS
jgi:dTDP-4-dehydrorhamnose 3,5-epimerase and related enzymes